MANSSSVFQIPNREQPAPAPLFVDPTPSPAAFVAPVKDPDLLVFEELNAISEEIEKCRRRANR